MKRELSEWVVLVTRAETGLAVMSVSIGERSLTRELTLLDGSVWLLHTDGKLEQLSPPVVR